MSHSAQFFGMACIAAGAFMSTLYEPEVARLAGAIVFVVSFIALLVVGMPT